MINKLESIYNKYLELTESLKDIVIASDFVKVSEINKSLKELQPIVELYEQYKTMSSQIVDDKKMITEESDETMLELIKEDLTMLNSKIEKLEQDIKLALLPKDVNDDRNAIMEIRAGTGGDEAGIFVGDLFRMYSRFIANKHWQLSMLNTIENSPGVYKEVSCIVKGRGAYGTLKYESGVHRVQRVPITETQGRIHTSAVSIVILPEIDDLTVDIDMNDVRKDTYCSTGAGGQGVNTTYSAVRLTHIPTGLVVTCQDERSQIKNFEKALKVLKSRLYDMESKKQHDEITTQKRSMVKHGDRSEKIRTYNYPQGRMTDHRINLTIYNLQSILDGNIENIIDALRTAENVEKLKQL